MMLLWTSDSVLWACECVCDPRVKLKISISVEVSSGRRWFVKRSVAYICCHRRCHPLNTLNGSFRCCFFMSCWICFDVLSFHFAFVWFCFHWQFVVVDVDVVVEEEKTNSSCRHIARFSRAFLSPSRLVCVCVCNIDVIFKYWFMKKKHKNTKKIHMQMHINVAPY